jgi:outer membrane biosynthesis protein TonB
MQQAEPKQEVKPDPVSEAIAANETEADAIELPTEAPAPEAKPKPPQAQTAKTPERKEAEKPVKQAAAKPKSEEKEFDADEVAALLNKEKASGGGAKRSTETASLGGDKTTNGTKLSQSEMDALRGQVQRCWNIPAGAADAGDLRVSVKFKLDRSGALEGSPEIISGGGSAGVERAAAEAARRAVSRCAPYNLPAEKYEAWADVIVNFDPSEMF